jgi:hypothetical protein
LPLPVASRRQQQACAGSGLKSRFGTESKNQLHAMGGWVVES